ncbi:MAG: NTPase [Nitrososphaerales archaeon]
MPFLIITGEPGVGKTTVIMGLVEMLRNRGISGGGIISREVRKDNVRIGFEFVNIRNNETAVLASLTGTGPRVGKYVVNLDGCIFAARVLEVAMQDAVVIICDELGPMEFKSKEFVDVVNRMLDLDKQFVVVVHKRLKHPVIDKVRQRADFMIEIDVQNRNKAPCLLLERLK